MKSVVNKAMELSPTMEICITVERTRVDVTWSTALITGITTLKDFLFPIQNVKQAISLDMLYLLYTSGSTGKPKALVHAHHYMYLLQRHTVWVLDINQT